MLYVLQNGKQIMCFMNYVKHKSSKVMMLCTKLS